MPDPFKKWGFASNPHSEDSKFLTWVPRAILNSNLWSAETGRSWRHHYNLPWSRYAKIIIWNSTLTAGRARLPAHQGPARVQPGSKSACAFSDLGQAVTCAYGIWEEDRHFLGDASSLTWLSCRLQNSALNVQLLCQHTPRHRNRMGLIGWTVSLAEGHRHVLLPCRCPERQTSKQQLLSHPGAVNGLVHP